MHVAKVSKRYVDKAGKERVHDSFLLRRSYREDGKVKHATVANVSELSGEQLDVLRRTLKGERLVPASAGAQVLRSLPHGDVAAVMVGAKALGLPALLGPRRSAARWPSTSPSTSPTRR